jgi:hypothetical protein
MKLALLPLLSASLLCTSVNKTVAIKYSVSINVIYDFKVL